MVKHIPIALIAGMAVAGSALAGTGLPEGVTTKTFQNPPKEFRLIQYHLTPGALKDYPNWGIGGYTWAPGLRIGSELRY